MTDKLIFLAVLSALELCLWIGFVWNIRKVVASVLIVTESIGIGILVGATPTTWTVLIGILGVYRVINLLRLIEGRTKAEYLYIVARRSSFALILMQVIVYGLNILSKHASLSSYNWMVVVLSFDALFATVLFVSTWRHLKTTRPVRPSKNYASKDLPAISVLIPARNETQDLEQCLESLVASSYPKLEVLVLDDCSQNKRTPEIIKSFAQAGVRFIAGELPPDNWLAKNFAYKQLADQASGDYLLFCGVDIRFEPDTLTKLLEIVLEKNKTLASVMPLNKLPSSFSLSSLIIQPARYGWELSLPRRLLNRPPILSTCWLIKHKVLDELGGFKAIARSASPESYFSRSVALKNNGYSFIRSQADLGLSSQKVFSEQRDTAIRTRYPQLHKRIELVMALTLLELAVFILPIGTLVYSVIDGKWLLFGLSCISVAGLKWLYAVLCTMTYQKFLIRSLALWPFAALFDVALLNYSMWQYEFSEVIWKGRNICLPIMRFSDPS